MVPYFSLSELMEPPQSGMDKLEGEIRPPKAQLMEVFGGGSLSASIPNILTVQPSCGFNRVCRRKKDSHLSKFLLGTRRIPSPRVDQVDESALFA